MNSALARERSDSANAPARPCPCIAQTVYTHRPQSQLRKRNKSTKRPSSPSVRLYVYFSTYSDSHTQLSLCVCATPGRSCSYPIADGSAQCELVPDYYGGDHVWLCSFDKPKWEDAE